MADPTPTPSPAPGAGTSEYAVTKITMILTIAATVIGTLLDVLPGVAAALPQATWLPRILQIVGLIGTVLTALGYQVTRAQVKVAAHAAAGVAASSAADAAANVGRS